MINLLEQASEKELITKWLKGNVRSGIRTYAWRTRGLENQRNILLFPYMHPWHTFSHSCLTANFVLEMSSHKVKKDYIWNDKKSLFQSVLKRPILWKISAGENVLFKFQCIFNVLFKVKKRKSVSRNRWHQVWNISIQVSENVIIHNVAGKSFREGINNQLVEKYNVRSGIRTHAWRTRLRPERSALDRSAILTFF